MLLVAAVGGAALPAGIEAGATPGLLHPHVPSVVTTIKRAAKRDIEPPSPLLASTNGERESIAESCFAAVSGDCPIRDPPWRNELTAAADLACYVARVVLSARTAVHEGADEGALVARARTGDVTAFGELYDRYAPHVLRVARLLLESGSDADDLLHDVFLEAWQSIRAYDPSRASVLTWLLVRTRSRAHDRASRRRRERQGHQVLLDACAAPRPPMAAELTLATRLALGELESPLRTAVELMYVAGLSAPEIAAQTGVAEGTIRSRAARALHQLARTLR